MNHKKAWLKQLLCSAATMVSMLAVFASQLPCEGRYYQPRVPEKLRK